MKQLSSSQIRQMFLDFFEEKGHQVRPSASLIPVNDPTLLWINSGVATLKPYFDGSQVPENPRITNSQKSIRTNDIENVGVTARHHTLFEMLGNFSIGDYHKREAIAWAWELLTSPDWFDFDPDLLYVTYYPEDQETREIWLEIEGFNPDHLVAEEGNFWDIGSGPCGPNTEIFYDRGEAYNDLAEDDPENYPGGENERWLEIWNLVFSELNHMPDGSYQPLPNKNVDTGMGLERMTSVIQDTPTNFETDLFMPIIRDLEQLSGHNYEQAVDLQTSFKVIADHIRAVSFAVSDGALPSNEGRGYILRRLIRRSIMHGRRLGISDLFLYRLVPTVADIMGDYYPELQANVDFVQEVIQDEERRFFETIEEGQSRLDDMIDDLKESGSQVLSGANAFMLYDTFGYPLELTQEILAENGMTVDEEGFDQEMQAQRERARSARSQEESMSAQSETLQSIDSDFEFVGYSQLETNGTIKYIIQEDRLVPRLDPQSEAWLVFNRTPFYAEGGGQVADIGGIYDGDELLGEVLDVQKAPNGQHMHRVRSFDLPLLEDQSYTLQVDRGARLSTMKNHTATHLLHLALHNILGKHANQAGSYVGPDRLRFDFSYFGKVEPDQLQQIENQVNYWIENMAMVNISEMPIEEAQEMGAMMLFGEKYGDLVRVVNIGNESIELCGGTHVANTNEIATFKLLSESGIGAGIRRIEALTGQAAIDYYQAKEETLDQVQVMVKAQTSDQIAHKIDQLQAQVKDQASQIESLTAKLMQQQSSSMFDGVKSLGDLTYLALHLADQTSDQLRQVGDLWRDQAASNLLILVSSQEDKVSLLVMADETAIGSGLKAGDVVKPLAQIVGGGGGGRPQMAQAGGRQPEKIGDLLDQVPGLLEDLLASDN